MRMDGREDFFSSQKSVDRGKRTQSSIEFKFTCYVYENHILKIHLENNSTKFKFRSQFENDVLERNIPSNSYSNVIFTYTTVIINAVMLKSISKSRKWSKQPSHRRYAPNHVIIAGRISARAELLIMSRAAAAFLRVPAIFQTVNTREFMWVTLGFPSSAEYDALQLFFVFNSAFYHVDR